MSVKGDAKSTTKTEPNSIGTSVTSITAQNEQEKDPFGCTCGPCKRFWKDNFTNISILSEPVLKRAQKTSTMFRPEQSDWRIKVGDRVVVDGKQNGVVLFVGLLDENVIAPPVYVGVKCDDNIGSTHNGTMNGKRYFHCARGHAALVPYTDVRRLNPAEVTPAVTGNYMFESYQEVVKTRALRRQKMEAADETKSKTVVAPKSRLRKTYTVYDENDVAYKDAQMEGGTQVYHYANSTVKVRTGGAPKPKIDPQARRFAKWKEEFGGGERGEKLVKTLKKLHEALNLGKELGDSEDLADEADEEELEEERPTTAPTQSSKPPTRTGDRSQPSRQPSPPKS
ncbi:uncharacterized protein [Watersipora subatra]|uniref:uncharacterized protein isoform X2 n=1 Tax=Watersipora subatra TaxID=2589382 RepID=UPI00355B8F26